MWKTVQVSFASINHVVPSILFIIYKVVQVMCYLESYASLKVSVSFSYTSLDIIKILGSYEKGYVHWISFWHIRLDLVIVAC